MRFFDHFDSIVDRFGGAELYKIYGSTALIIIGEKINETDKTYVGFYKLAFSHWHKKEFEKNELDACRLAVRKLSIINGDSEGRETYNSAISQTLRSLLYRFDELSKNEVINWITEDIEPLIHTLGLDYESFHSQLILAQSKFGKR